MTWEYIAGFFDGEGSIAPNGIGVRISIPQTNEEVLTAIRNFSGVGSIVKVTKRREHWKDSWTYYIASKKDIKFFLEKITPHLVVKKEVAIKATSLLRLQLAEMNKREQLYRNRKFEAKLLRKRGWSYRKIGEKMKVDWGYIRRLVLDLH